MSYCKRVLHTAGVFGCVVLALPAAAGPPELSVQPNAIEIGDSCRIVWRTDGSRTFISGVGSVEKSGSLVRSPTASTTYRLLTTVNGKVSHVSADVTVEGTKGAHSRFLASVFEPGVSGSRSDVEPLELLGIAHRVLQDELGLSVDGEFLPGRPWWVLYTNSGERNVETEPGVLRERVAYYVRVDDAKPGHPVSFEVRARVERQLFGQRTWRAAEDQQVAHEAAQQLRRRLEASGT